MNNYDLHQQAQDLELQVSPYQLARRLIEAEEEIYNLNKLCERLDNELQDKALTDDDVLADCYWHCCNLIDPYLGEETGKYTLINSVGQSLEFLIEQWKEKAVLEGKIAELETKNENIL